MRNLSVEHRVLGAFGAALLVLLTIGALGYENARRLLDDTRASARAHELIGALEALLSQVHRAEAAQRGYIVAGTPRYLELRNEAIAEIEPVFDRLEQLVADNPAQRARIPALRELTRQRIEVFERFRLLRETEGLAAAARAFGPGPPLMSQLRARVHEMQEAERRGLQRREAGAAERVRNANLVFAVLAVALLVVLLLSFKRLQRDMRARQLAEARVRADEERFRGLLESAPDAMVIVDSAGRMTLVNAQAEKTFGYPRAALQGQPVEMLVPERFRARHRDYRAAFGANPQARPIDRLGADLIGQRHDGSEFPAEISLSPLQTADGLLTTAVVRDITERRHAEHTLAENAAREETYGRALALFNSTYQREAILSGVLALLAQNYTLLGSAIYLHDEWSGILRLAVARGDIDGLSQEFGLDDSRIGDAVLHNRTIEMTGADVGITVVLEGARHASAILLVVPIAHLERRLGVLLLAVHEAPPARERVLFERLCVQLGVTLNNLKQYHDLKLLAEQLRVRSEEIAHKNDQLEQASRMKSEFLANMSHELRTPLNAIIGFSELLKEGLLGPLSGEQKDHVNDIFGSGQHLLQLINDILDLSKIEAGHMEIAFEPTDVGNLLQGSLSIVKEKAMAHRLTLNLEIDPLVGHVLLDPRRTKQIVYNLLSNAVKFTPDGGRVTLAARRVRTPNEHSPPLLLAGEYLELSVADSGIGIAREDQERLFQPFTQIDSTLARRYQGTGLGLAMVKRLAELHGGAVSLVSERDRGSMFRVRLPYRGTEKIAAPSVMRTRRQTRGNGMPLALIVEDDDAAADIERLHLEQKGFQTMRVTTAEAALTAATDRRPDVIILDLLLPGMDGWEFLARIKAKSALAHIPVVIVSIVADATRGFALGAASVLQKPIVREELLAAVRSLGLAPRAATDRRDIHVLIADDDPKAVEIVATHLEGAQYRVTRAYGGREAIETIQRSPPHLLILDLMMPEVNGFDVVRELKGSDRTASIPILILTAKLPSAEDRRLLSGHVMRIIEKSEFSGAEFLGEVQRALSQWIDSSPGTMQ
jgi:PAS domain S-box-containing protein